MNYLELLALPLEELVAKYKEVLKEEPAADANKQQLASAVAKALAAETEKQPPADEEQQQPDSKKVLKEEPAADVVHLVQKDTKGKVVDQMTLKKKAWLNLPAGHKEKWQVKTPAELKK